MQIPNAAGFIPNQSVVDGLINVFNTFGRDAKDRRQAELGQTKAQTANIQAVTDWIPDKSAQGWTGLDLEDQRIKESSRQWDSRVGQEKTNGLIDMFKSMSMSNATSPESQKSLAFDILSNLGSMGPAGQTKLEVDQVNQARQGMIDKATTIGAPKKGGPTTPAGIAINSMLHPALGLYRAAENYVQSQPSGAPKENLNNSALGGGIGGLMGGVEQLFNMLKGLGSKKEPQAQTQPTSSPSGQSLNQLQVPSNVPTASASTPALDQLFAQLKAGQGNRGNATIFGHMLDGSPDPEDNGLGAFGANTRDPKLEGVSLPFATLDQNFGSHRNANDIRNALVAVLNPKTGQQGSFPIVDKGPAGWTGNSIDLTGAAGKRLGATGKDEMIFQILKSLPKT